MCDPLFISVQLRIKKIRYQISVLVTYIYCVVLVRNYTFFDMINNPKFLKDMDNSSNTRLGLGVVYVFHKMGQKYYTYICYVIISAFMYHIVKLIVLCIICFEMFIYAIKFIAPLTNSSIHQLRIEQSPYSIA